MSKITLKIKGMDCASCALTISHRLKKQEGIKRVDINFASEKAIIEYIEEEININKIKEVIKSTGYENDESNRLEAHEHSHAMDEKKQKKKCYFCCYPYF